MYVANTKRLTLAGARKMMTTAIGEAEAAGIPIAVAIADAGGHLIMLERMDGGRFHTVHSSTTASRARRSKPSGPPTASMRNKLPESSMLLFAHRSYHIDAAENTLPAFHAAAKLGVAGIETDVRLSRDGLPVDHHP